MSKPSVQPEPPRSLKKECLSYPEVVAQSVAVIAPATVPAAVIGLIFASSAGGTWLSFALAMVGLIFVSININQFARRSASPGSLYTYIVKGLGPTSGVMGGWSLLAGYTFTGMSTLCGFAIFGQLLLGYLGIHLHILVYFVFGAALSCAVAYRNIQLSAKMMLVFELAAIVLIVGLGVVIWSHAGFVLDTDQFTLKGATASGVVTGIVLAIFGFSGFESSTSLGDEAKNPLKTIPRSLIQSTLISGFFFIFMAYVVVAGFKGTGIDLGKTEAPLDALATRAGVGFWGVLVSIGALLSFFSCTLACVNSTARIIFSMSRHGLLHDALGDAHETNETPHVAVVAAALITLLIPAAIYFAGITAFDAQGYLGTMASFGFLVVYILVSLAAPVYLKNLGLLRVKHVIYAALAVALMILPLVATIGIPGSKLFPPPSFPDSLFVWLFIAYMLVGLGWLFVRKYRSPDVIATMQSSIEEIHVKFGDVKEDLS